MVINMNKKTMIKIAGASAAVAIAAAVGVGVWANPVSVDAAVEWSDVTVSDSSYGSVFNVPQRKVNIAGEQYSAVSSVIYPDGRAVSSENIVLNQAGKYTVRYTVTDKSGKTYFEEESFVVKHATFSFEKEGTSAEYVEGYSYPGYDTESDGLMVRLQEQDAISFSGMITIPKEEDKTIYLADFFVTPDEVGSADAKTIDFVFTDVTDSSKTLRIQINVNAGDSDSADGWWAMYTYVLAAGDGQILKGLEGTTNIHENDGYGGVVVSNSFYAVGKNKMPTDPSLNGYKIGYNPVSQVITVNDRFIIDLDDKAYFGGLADVQWKGFTSDKVRLSVYAENYKKQSANFLIRSVKDIDLNGTVVEDDEAPVITIDTEYDTDKMPESYVGEGVYYPVPEATAFDLFSGEVDVSVGVYLNYNAGVPIKITVEDGKFEVKERGMYAIVYTAKDHVGNTAEKIAWVHAGGEIEEIGFVGAGVQTNGVVGEKFTVNIPEITGGTGDSEVTATVSIGGKVEMTFTEDDVDWSFYPETAGAWMVVYKATDFLGKTAQTAVVTNLVIPSAPVFRGEVEFPNVLVDGFEYKLPELLVYDFMSGTLSVEKASVEVTDKNGSKTYLSGNSFVPEVNENGDKITVRYFYAYGDGEEITLPEEELPVIIGINRADANQSVIVANYFYADEKTFTASKTDENGKTYSDGVLFTVNKAGNSKWIFANAVAAKNFTLDIRTVSGKSNFTALSVKLTDSENARQSLTVRLVKGYSTYRVVTGNVSENTTIPVSGTANISVGFTEGRVLLGGSAFDPVVNDYGEKFTGFSSGKINVEFTAENASVGAQYHIYSVSGQLTNSLYDYVSPTIVTTGNYGGAISLGSTYYISSAIAADVLAPTVDFDITVTAPGGSVARDINGLLLDKVDPSVGYYLLCDSYGEYRISYTAKESGVAYPNEEVSFYTVTVIDETAPVADIKSVATKVKVGATVYVPSYTVTDDITPSDKIIVQIGYRDPYGRFRSIKGNGFVCSAAGKYELRFFVIDEAGNSAMYNYTIEAV